MNEWELHMSNFPGHRLSGNLIFRITCVRINFPPCLGKEGDSLYKARFQIEGSLPLPP